MDISEQINFDIENCMRINVVLIQETSSSSYGPLCPSLRN